MVERYRPQAEASVPRNIFAARRELAFLPTGSTLLDCVIGGGWPFGRVVNIVGDRSTGKTLLAEEAMANLVRSYPGQKPRYRETESAFDVSYFQALGSDPDQIDFGKDGQDTMWQTVEDIIEDLRAYLDGIEESVATKFKALKDKSKRKKGWKADDELKKLWKGLKPSLYIVDSLDALSSVTEMGRDIREGSYNLEKPKLLGEMFRKEIRRIKRSKVCLIIISQIRDRIGANIRGVKYTRTGGKALDFYASIVLYMADLGKVKETIKGVTRPVAVKVKAKCTKNKISMPFRECEFEIRFGYGIDDDWSCLEWLKSVKRLDVLGLKDIPTPKQFRELDLEVVKQKTVAVWQEIEKGFTPEKGKYAA